MTLKQRYAIKNKKRWRQFIFIYSILVIFFGMYSSLAKYERASEGYIKIAVADWKIKLNGKELTGSSNTLTDSITLTPTTNIDASDPTKIKPGQEGYFDIEINPAGTEVSFEYQVTLDLVNSKLPTHFSILSYSLNDGAPTILPPDNVLNGSVSLGDKNIFEKDSDKQTIRYYWKWDDGDGEGITYTIVANVEVKQIL